MTLRAGLGVVLLALSLIAAPPVAWAQQGTCITPGVIVEVPTPAALRDEEPNLRLLTNSGFERVTILSFTTSRIRIRMPSIGLPVGAPIKLLHLGEGRNTLTLGNLRICEEPDTGDTGGGGSDPGPEPGGDDDDAGAGSRDAIASGVAAARERFLTRRNRVPLERATRNASIPPSV